jgi:hypothetical protein
MIVFVEYFCRDETAIQALMEAGPVAFFRPCAADSFDSYLQEMRGRLAAKSVLAYGRRVVGTDGLYTCLVAAIRKRIGAGLETIFHCEQFAIAMRNTGTMKQLRKEAKAHNINITMPRRAKEERELRKMWSVTVPATEHIEVRLRNGRERFEAKCMCTIDGVIGGDPARVTWGWLQEFHDGMFTLLTAVCGGGVERSRLWTHVQVSESADFQKARSHGMPLFTRTRFNGFEWALGWGENAKETKTTHPHHWIGRRPSAPLQDLTDFYVSKLIPLIHLKAGKDFDAKQPFHLFFANIKFARPHNGAKTGSSTLRTLLKQVDCYDFRFDGDGKVQPGCEHMKLRVAHSTSITANMKQSTEMSGFANGSKFALARVPMYRIVERHTAEEAMASYDKCGGIQRKFMQIGLSKGHHDELPKIFTVPAHQQTDKEWLAAHDRAFTYGYKFYYQNKSPPPLFDLSPQARALLDDTDPPAPRAVLAYLQDDVRLVDGDDDAGTDESQHGVARIELPLDAAPRPQKPCQCGSSTHQRKTNKDCPLNRSKRDGTTEDERGKEPACRHPHQQADTTGKSQTAKRCKCGATDHQRTSCRKCPLHVVCESRSPRDDGDDRTEEREYDSTEESDDDSTEESDDEDMLVQDFCDARPALKQSTQSSNAGSPWLTEVTATGYSAYNGTIDKTSAKECLVNDEWFKCIATQQVEAGLKCFFEDDTHLVVPTIEITTRVRDCRQTKKEPGTGVVAPPRPMVLVTSQGGSKTGTQLPEKSNGTPGGSYKTPATPNQKSVRQVRKRTPRLANDAMEAPPKRRNAQVWQPGLGRRDNNMLGCVRPQCSRYNRFVPPAEWPSAR